MIFDYLDDLGPKSPTANSLVAKEFPTYRPTNPPVIVCHAFLCWALRWRLSCMKLNCKASDSVPRDFRFPSCGVCIRNTSIDRFMVISSVNISRVVFYLCSNLRKAFGKIVLWESLSLRQVTKGYTSLCSSELSILVHFGPLLTQYPASTTPMPNASSLWRWRCPAANGFRSTPWCSKLWHPATSEYHKGLGWSHKCYKL